MSKGYMPDRKDGPSKLARQVIAGQGEVYKKSDEYHFHCRKCDRHVGPYSSGKKAADELSDHQVEYHMREDE